MMSKKHYIAFAKIIKRNTLVKSGKMLPTLSKTAVVSELCTLFVSDNNNFDMKRFIDACDIVDDQLVRVVNSDNTLSPRNRGLFVLLNKS